MSSKQADSNAAFEVTFEVRDYECDLQGVVNNAVYLNYLEHARHQYLLSVGIDFAELHQSGCDLVLTRIEVDYKDRLRSGDHLVVTVAVSRESRLRFAFDQQVLKLPERTPVIAARAIGTGIVNGRPRLPEVLLSLLDG